MLRTTIARTAQPAVARRFFSSSSAVMGAGDTGSVRPQGERASDSFTKREKAAEEMYIRDEERRKLLQIREKLAAQRKHIDELDKHLEDLTKDHGGEQN